MKTRIVIFVLFPAIIIGGLFVWLGRPDSPRHHIQLISGIEVPLDGVVLESAERFDGIDGGGGEYIFSLSEEAKNRMTKICEDGGGILKENVKVNFDIFFTMDSSRNYWRTLDEGSLTTCGLTSFNSAERKSTSSDGRTMFDESKWSMIVAGQFLGFRLVKYTRSSLD